MGSVIPPMLSRDMGLTLEDFIRSLPSAIAPLTYQVEGRQFTIEHPNGSVVIALGETGERRIASLSLPVTPVDFQFNGLDETARSHFMQRFDRYFQRGGG
ncbi:MAG: hypothetical protein OQL17_02340 [Sedimenticola sp.]|uniref:Uncharacterized protein n=1 Tax=Sedimenticola thiotaurini TaxID=1543721 RepID=A0A558D482_9GAMM|nr:hypothetical protein [Sedimenticola sp.]MCW8948793.1 hypothetical protein [Sedimenticola sp.]MCW8974462.1 hypothetical protein [Sedimenticola sp.]TVT55822.1 MAG: hypothetical protein FHK82_07755 [Sedimenticola thiotaurini]